METVKSGKIQLLSQPHFIFRQEIPIVICLVFSLLISSVSLCFSLSPLPSPQTAQLSPLPLCRVIYKSSWGAVHRSFNFYLFTLFCSSPQEGVGRDTQPRLKASWELFVYLGWLWAQPKLLCYEKQVPFFPQGIVRT